MKTSRRNWVAAAVVAGLLIAGGAGQAWATDFTWDGNGNSNNSGDWSSPNNWNLDSSYPQTAADNATLPAATAGSRTVTVDVPVVVNNLTWDQSSAANTLMLNADLSITGLLTTRGNGPNNLFVSAGKTLIVNGNSNWENNPVYQGTGTIAKEGVVTYYWGADVTHPFSGTIEVRAGKMHFQNYTATLTACPEVKVLSGVTNGTFELNCSATPDRLPMSFTIAGPGYLDQGALRWIDGNTAPNTFRRPITVANDASVYVASGKTVTFDAALGGSGTLTLFGGGTFSIASTTSTHDGAIIVSNATLSVSGLLQDVTAITLLGGAVLNGAQVHFPSATVDATGGTWNSTDTSATWTGGGDGTSWSDAANWVAQVPDGLEAIIPAAGSPRNISVDADAHVSKLTWLGGGASDTITLDANLVVDVMASKPVVNLDINGNTLFVDYAVKSEDLPVFRGSGLIVKQGVSKFYLGWNNVTHPFTGEWIVSNGTLYAENYGGVWLSCPKVTVASGAGVSGTVQFNTPSTPHYLPLSFTIAGPGYDNLGALRWTQGNTAPNSFKRPITVQADATVSIASGQTVELDTTLGGSGTLTLIGGGHLKILTGTSTLNGMIVINGGTTLSVPGALPGVTNITINAGGILNGGPAHFASATVVNNGGTWNSIDTASTWSGLGDNETWSQAANWFGAVPTGIEAIIPAAGSARDISVDVDANVSKLTWQGGGASDTITLNADLVVSNMNSKNVVNLDIKPGRSVFVDRAEQSQLLPVFRGGGRIVKQGTNTFYLGFDNTGNTFTGEWVVSNGTLYAEDWGGAWLSCPKVTVVSDAGVSGTVRFHAQSTPHYLPLSFTIAGPGYNNLGALRWTQGNTGGNAFARPITVQADATCYIGSGLTVEHTRVLDGNGVMTIIGGGTYDMNNVWTGTVSGATCNGIVAAAGTVDIEGCTLSLAGLETASANEYVLVDYASANGYLVGTNFAAVNGLTGKWLIDYDGTRAHPDAVVLVLPSPPGTMLIIR